MTVTWPGRNGLIRRAFVIPSNPRTFDQLTVRNRLQTVTAGWRALTDARTPGPPWPRSTKPNPCSAKAAP